VVRVAVVGVVIVVVESLVLEGVRVPHLLRESLPFSDFRDMLVVSRHLHSVSFLQRG
jgi:hypothetical protein